MRYSIPFYKFNWSSIYRVFMSLNTMTGLEHNMQNNTVREVTLAYGSMGELIHTAGQVGKKDFIGARDHLNYEFKHVGGGLMYKQKGKIDLGYTRSFPLCNPFENMFDDAFLQEYYHNNLKDKIHYLMVNDGKTNSFYVIPFTLLSPDNGTIILEKKRKRVKDKISYQTLIKAKLPIEVCNQFCVVSNVKVNLRPNENFKVRYEKFRDDFIYECMRLNCGNDE